MKRGTRPRWTLGPRLLTLDKRLRGRSPSPTRVGRARGMRTRQARRDAYILNEQTVHHERSVPDTRRPLRKLDDQRHRHPPPQVANLVLDPRLEGFEQSAPFRKMGQHSSPPASCSSPTLSWQGPPARRDREGIGCGGRASAKDNLSPSARDRPMALGVIESAWRSHRLRKTGCCGQADREFSSSTEAANMECRLNVENLVFRHIEMSAAGRSLSWPRPPP